MPDPTTGRIENAIVTTAQNRLFGRPATPNATPSNRPWIAATAPVPITVETVTSLKRLPSFSVFFLENGDRKSTRLNSSHSQISYAVFCLKKKKDFVRAQAVSECTALRT